MAGMLIVDVHVAMGGVNCLDVAYGSREKVLRLLLGEVGNY